MVQEVLSENLEEPRITIHLHTDLLEIMNNRMVKIAQAANFEGQVLVLEDDSITPGDCRVIWSSGSAERDMGALWQQIDEVVEKNLHAVQKKQGSLKFILIEGPIFIMGVLQR